MNLQHIGCWNHLEKLAEMLVNTFHREHILLILKIKKLLRKIKSKNLTAGFFKSRSFCISIKMEIKTCLSELLFHYWWRWVIFKTIAYGV